MLKKVMRLFLVLVMGIGSLNFTSLVVSATEQEYEIYPNPHTITYEQGEYVMRGAVNVVYDDSIDDATKNRLSEVLSSKGKEVVVSNEKDDTKTNIYVGTYGSDGNASRLITANYAVDNTIATKKGGHQVFSNNGSIAIIGKDSDAAFYGITSLKHIFDQIDGSTLRNFTISDYADTNIRGFIEGYYGIPWSNDDRKSLMKFGGDFKMTAYVFAPKDDPYHSAKWRDPYPDDKLAEIQDMAAVGEASKCRFVWTIHPFMNGGIKEATYDKDIQKIIDKFEQLYSVGVRQFGVLGDDAGSLPKSVVIRVMNDLQAWSNSKGDVHDLVFCPGGYNKSWWSDGELDQYDEGFDKSIQIFWTGNSVCAPVSKETLVDFKNYKLPAGKNPRRSPLFWLNWPVNDINGEKLMMGKGSLLHTDINVDDLAGVVTNPMQEAEASKVALFAVADYSWNVKKFDDDTSWADSFKYIDADASEYLHTLAKHMSNPEPNGHGLVLAESEELTPLITQFNNALSTNNLDEIKVSGTKLIEEMDIIINACDGFINDSKNENLKKELSPFVGSLKDLALSIKYFTQSKIALIDKDSTSAFNYFTNGTASFANSKSHGRKLISGQSMNVSPGATKLRPLADSIQKNVSKEMDQIIGSEDESVKITASSSFKSFYGGTKIESIIDGNLSTYALHDGVGAVGQYFQINLSKPSAIYGIDLANGRDGHLNDTFKKAKLQYSTDNGTNWLDVNGTVYTDSEPTVSVVGIKLDDVTNVRYLCTEASGNWPAMREFKVSTEPTTPPSFTREVIKTDIWKVYNGGNEQAIFDGDDNTGVHYSIRQGSPTNPDSTIAGDYIGVKLSKEIVLGKIHIAQAPTASSGDYFTNCDLEYSLDGTNWTKIQSFTDKVINVDLSEKNITAKYVRLKNTKTINKWIGMREFQVEAKVFFNSNAYTNVASYKDLKVNIKDDNGVFEPVKNVKLAKNEYIGIKLKRIHALKEIVSDLSLNDKLTIEVSKNGIEWDTAKAGANTSDARYIRLINKTDEEVNFDVNEFRVQTDEVKQKEISSLSGFEVSSKAEGLKLADGDWTTSTSFSGSQIKGSYFVYDLGQEIMLNSFKAVCVDSEWDYPRHGKFSVSNDGVNWTEIMTVGNQDGENPGESTNTDNIQSAFPTHEISYNTKEAKDFEHKVRYIKFEITRTKVGADKWIRFQEFELNGGAYLPTEKNPTIVSTSPESRSSKYSYMTDSNLTTIFAPTENTGNINLAVSDKNDKVNTLRIIQDSNKISNAKVSVRVKTSTNETKWVNLGTLSQTINEFKLPKNSAILDAKIEWKDTKVAITEITLLTRSASESVDKAELQRLLDNLEITSNWTLSSVKAYTQAIETAKLVNDSEVSQSSVDSAVILVKNAISNKEEKGDITILEERVGTAFTDATQYTISTWKVYNKAIENAKVAITNKDDLSQSKIDSLVKSISDSEKGLVFNPMNRELALLAKQDIDLFIKSIATPNDLYTVDSFEKLKEEQARLAELISLDDKDKNQSPKTFKDATKKLEDAKANLVSVKSLPALIKAFQAEDESVYVEISFASYKSAIEVAKGLLVNGTDKLIAEQIKEIEKAKSELVLKSTMDHFMKYIDSLEKVSKDDYTKKSVDSLNEMIEVIKSKSDKDLIKNMSKYMEQLKSAHDGLISVVELRATINQASDLDSKDFKKSGFDLLVKEIDNAKKLYVNGSKKEISESIKKLNDTMLKLEIKVDKNEAKNFVNGIQKVSSDAYTKESYDRYLAAYDKLINMLKDLDDVSAKEFILAKDSFNSAYQGLKLKDKVDTGDIPNVTPPVIVGGNNGVQQAVSGVGQVITGVTPKVTPEATPKAKETPKTEVKKGKEAVKADPTPKAVVKTVNKTKGLSLPIVIGIAGLAIVGAFAFVVAKKKRS